MHWHSFGRRLESGFFFRPSSILRKFVSLLAIWSFAFSTLPAYPATSPSLAQPMVAMHGAILPQAASLKSLESLAPKQIAQAAQTASAPLLLKKEASRLAALKKPAAMALQASSTIVVFAGYADSSGP